MRLARIADANAEEPVEVEELWRRQRVHVVLVVEGVEHLDSGNELHAFAKADGAICAEVERKEHVVLAEVVAPAVDSRAAAGRNHKPSRRILKAAGRSGTRAVDVVGNGFGRMRLHADIGMEAPGEVGNCVSIEFVAFVAVGVGIFRSKVKEVRITEGKGIALVGIIVLVDGISVVSVEEEVMTQALPHAEGDTAIERLRPAIRVGDVAEVWKQAMNIDIVDGVLPR